MSGPAAELPTASPASRRHAGRKSLPPSISLVAAAVAPLRSLHVKPAAAYTKGVSPTARSSMLLREHCCAIPHIILMTMRWKRSTYVLSGALCAGFLALGVVLYLSDIFVVTGTDPNSKIVAAAIALVGTLVTAVVSMLAVALKHALDTRAEARLSIESERTAIMQREAEDRLKLEAATKAVQLFATPQGQLAPSIQRSGALFTLSNLGQHSLAIALTAELLRSREVEPAVAARVLDAALRSRNLEYQSMAIDIFFENASAFLTPTSYELPMSPFEPSASMPPYISALAYFGCIKLMLARPFADWRGAHRSAGWGLLGMLIRAWQNEESKALKQDMAALLAALLPLFPEARFDVSGMAMDAVRKGVRGADTASENAQQLADEITIWSQSSI